MNKKDNLYDYLKNIKVPQFKNDNHYRNLRTQIVKKINEFEDNRSKSFFRRPVFRYSLGFSVIILIIIISFFTIFQYANNKYLICKALTVQGNAVKISKNKKLELAANDLIDINDEIVTDIDSNLKLQIGENSYISINENSSLKLLSSNIKNNKTDFQLALLTGKIYAEPAKLNKDEIFEIKTNILNARVYGTKFSVEVDKNYNSIISVDEGKVKITPVINLKHSFKNDDKAIINEIINTQIILNENETLTINEYDIKIIENEINNLDKNSPSNTEKLNTIKLRIKNHFKKDKTKNEEKNIINNSNKEDKSNTSNENNVPDEYIITKIADNPGIILDERDTYISADNNNIYIVNDKSSTLYTISPKTGKVIWEFSDADLLNITSKPVSLNNFLILPTPKNIYKIKNGEKAGQINLEKGINFWAEPVVYQNRLLIPCSNYIYKYDGFKIDPLNNLELSGQSYITLENNILYINDLNQQVLTAYDLKNEKKIWTGDKLVKRSFLKPVLNEKYLFIADSEGYIYKFDKSFENTNYEITKIESTILSNIIYIDKNLFFVANDGYFYKISLNSFNKPVKLIKIENNLNNDKYLVKKVTADKTNIYFSSDTGKIFIYNINNQLAELIKINDNIENNPLIGSPVIINNEVYFIDNKLNIYKRYKK